MKSQGLTEFTEALLGVAERFSVYFLLFMNANYYQQGIFPWLQRDIIP
jgi:hypothetical protein